MMRAMETQMSIHGSMFHGPPLVKSLLGSFPSSLLDASLGLNTIDENKRKPSNDMPYEELAASIG